MNALWVGRGIRSRSATAWLGGAVAAIAVMAAVVSPTEAEPKQEADTATSAKLMAVKFHADWCGSCKAMGNRFADLQNKLDTEPVLFVKLDLTTRSSRKQAEYMTAALKLGDLWPTYGGKTGFILLVDPANGRVVETLTKQHDFKQMASAINRTIGEAG